MTGRYKVIGIDPGDTDFQLGNCLTLRRSPNAVSTPGMYAKTRNSTVFWMNSIGHLDQLRFFDELFASDVVLNHADPEPRQQGDRMEGAVLIAALLIAFPDARFGVGLPGDEDFLGHTNHYRSLGKQPVAFPDGGEARNLLAELFDFLRNNSYWVDYDLVHILALLSAVCHDRDRTTPVKVLSLSTSGNHQVDPGLFHAYQLVEALLEVSDGESLRDAVARWNARYSHRLDPAQLDFIRNARDVSLHFRADRAAKRLRASAVALGFDLDPARQSEFRNHGIQKLLREAARAYFLARLVGRPAHGARV